MVETKTEQLETNIHETQENSPDVSADEKKEKEQNENTENTEISLVGLQKEIAEKLVSESDEETRRKLVQMQTDILSNQNDQMFLSQKKQELDAISLEDQPLIEKYKGNIVTWFASTSLGVSIFAGLRKLGLGDRVDELMQTPTWKEKQEKIAKSKEGTNSQAKDSKEKETGNEESPEEASIVEEEIVDESIAEVESAEEEKKPEVTKSQIKGEVNDALAAFEKVCDDIDSNFSMFDKDDAEIEADGKKLADAEKKVTEALGKIGQHFPEDAEMQEVLQAGMNSLAEYYSDRGVDNDHHEDPIKAVKFLMPSINNLKDTTGEKIELPAMPTEDDLLASLVGTKLGETIAMQLSKGLSMDQILEDPDIVEKRNDQYKKLFDKREKQFDKNLSRMYAKYKAGKYPHLTPAQKKALETMKDIQGVHDRWDRKDRNVDMAKNIAGTVGAVAVGITATALTGGVAGVALGGALTTAGMRANENKRVGGKDMSINLAMNTIPFGVGKAFQYLRQGALVAKGASKALIGATYAAEGVVDVGVMSAGHSLKTDVTFIESVEENIGWGLLPLALHVAPSTLKGGVHLKNIFARKKLAEETLGEVQRAKILAHLGYRNLSTEILDKLNAKLKDLKRKETMSVLDEEAALVAKKDTLLHEATSYINQNTIPARISVKSTSKGFVDNLTEVGDKAVVFNMKGVRQEIAVLKVDGKNSIVSIDGIRTARADLTGGKLQITDPVFRGEKITGAYVSKHPKAGGKDINVLMKDLEVTKTDLSNIRALSRSLETFNTSVNDLHAIYPILKNDLKGIAAGKSLNDFLGYTVTKNTKGFSVVDKSGHTVNFKNSREVLHFVLPKAEANGARLLEYKLKHFYANNISPEKVQAILQKSALGRSYAKVDKILGGKADAKAYEINLDGMKYQVHFDKSVPEGVVFKDATGAVIDATHSVIPQLEKKIFMSMSEKYKAFALRCKDVKTPLGRLLPDRIKPKVLKILSQKLHRPIATIENMTYGPVMEAMEKFVTAPSVSSFVKVLAGGSTLNGLLIGTTIVANSRAGEQDEIGTDYMKYVFGGQLAGLVDLGNMIIEGQQRKQKEEQAQGETFETV